MCEHAQAHIGLQTHAHAPGPGPDLQPGGGLYSFGDSDGIMGPVLGRREQPPKQYRSAQRRGCVEGSCWVAAFGLTKSRYEFLSTWLLLLCF